MANFDMMKKTSTTDSDRHEWKKHEEAMVFDDGHMFSRRNIYCSPGHTWSLPTWALRLASTAAMRFCARQRRDRECLRSSRAAWAFNALEMVGGYEWIVNPSDDKIWLWINTYKYYFLGMNIHLPAILMFTRSTGF